MAMETKILIVEHDSIDIDLVRRELSKGGIPFISENVQHEAGYRAAIDRFLPDIILSDYSFPSFDGLAAFEIRQSMAPDTPFLFVTGALGEETSVDLIKRGVTDFVLKDKMFTLCPKVNRALVESAERRSKRKVELDLVKSEMRLSRAQQLAHMGSWEFNLVTRELLLSQEACRICGLPSDQSRQSFGAALAFVHPEDLKIVLKKIKRAQVSLSDFSTKIRIVLRSGSTRYIFLECKFEFDQAGMPSGLHGVMHDITETTLLENSLIEERLNHQQEITQAVMTAQEKERAFIGWELQENISQILAATKIYIKMASTNVSNRKIYLGKTCVMVQDALDEIKKISRSLVIPSTHFIGLYGSIRNLLHDTEEINSIAINFQAKDVEEKFMDEKLQLTIFRIVQEQVANILKHAKAPMAAISLTKEHNHVVLRISDNGGGCDTSKKTKGVGIINIRSRTEAYRGNLSILTKPGEGYELKVALPFPYLSAV
jgi:two-component system, NarL family, sensor histidine kinase UhpB